VLLKRLTVTTILLCPDDPSSDSDWPPVPLLLFCSDWWQRLISIDWPVYSDLHYRWYHTTQFVVVTDAFRKWLRLTFIHYVVLVLYWPTVFCDPFYKRPSTLIPDDYYIDWLLFIPIHCPSILPSIDYGIPVHFIVTLMRNRFCRTRLMMMQIVVPHYYHLMMLLLWLHSLRVVVVVPLPIDTFILILLFLRYSGLYRPDARYRCCSCSWFGPYYEHLLLPLSIQCYCWFVLGIVSIPSDALEWLLYIYSFCYSIHSDLLIPWKIVLLEISILLLLFICCDGTLCWF